MQKSYCYTPGVGVRVGVRMQNVRANVKVLEFKSFCIFFLHFKFAYHTNKAPYNKSLRQARIRWLWHLWYFYEIPYWQIWLHKLLKLLYLLSEICIISVIMKFNECLQQLQKMYVRQLTSTTDKPGWYWSFLIYRFCLLWLYFHKFILKNSNSLRFKHAFLLAITFENLWHENLLFMPWNQCQIL